MTNTDFIRAKSDTGYYAKIQVPSLTADTTYILGVGGGTINAGGVSGQEIAVTTSTTATIGRYHRCSGTASDYTVTLPAVSGLAGQCIGFIMDPGLTKLVTLDGNGSETINGMTTRIMWAGESCVLRVNDSETGWEKVGGRSIPMVSGLYLSSNQSVAANTGVKVNVNMAHGDSNCSLMQDTTNKGIKVRRPGIYMITGSIEYAAGTGTGTYRYIGSLYKNASGLQSIAFSHVGNAAGNKNIIFTRSTTCAADDMLYLYTSHSDTVTTTTYVYGAANSTHIIVTEVAPW